MLLRLSTVVIIASLFFNGVDCSDRISRWRNALGRSREQLTERTRETRQQIADRSQRIAAGINDVTGRLSDIAISTFDSIKGSAPFVAALRCNERFTEEICDASLIRDDSLPTITLVTTAECAKSVKRCAQPVAVFAPKRIVRINRDSFHITSGYMVGFMTLASDENEENALIIADDGIPDHYVNNNGKGTSAWLVSGMGYSATGELGSLSETTMTVKFVTKHHCGGFDEAFFICISFETQTYPAIQSGSPFYIVRQKRRALAGILVTGGGVSQYHVYVKVHNGLVQNALQSAPDPDESQQLRASRRAAQEWHQHATQQTEQERAEQARQEARRKERGKQKQEDKKKKKNQPLKYHPMHNPDPNRPIPTVGFRPSVLHDDSDSSD